MTFYTTMDSVRLMALYYFLKYEATHDPEALANARMTARLLAVMQRRFRLAASVRHTFDGWLAYFEGNKNRTHRKLLRAYNIATALRQAFSQGFIAWLYVRLLGTDSPHGQQMLIDAHTILAQMRMTIFLDQLPPLPTDESSASSDNGPRNRAKK